MTDRNNEEKVDIQKRPMFSFFKDWFFLPSAVLFLIIQPLPVFAGETLFRPSGCEFSVTFPNAPKVQSISTNQGAMQQAILEHGVSLFRAECGARNKEDMAIFQKRLRESLLQQANLAGLENPSIEVESSTIGTIGTYRGFKKVGGEFYQYTSRVYFGKRTMFQVFLFEPSRQSPTIIGNSFLNSVKRYR